MKKFRRIFVKDPVHLGHLYRGKGANIRRMFAPFLIGTFVKKKKSVLICFFSSLQPFS